MNVLVIPTWYPNGTDKLMGIYHKEFCRALAKRENMHVNMLYIDRQRLNAPLQYIMMKKEEIIEEDGYQVYIKRMLDVHKISFDLQIKRYVKTLEKAYLEYLKIQPKPDIIHAQVMMPAGYAACILGEKYHIPVVITEHSSYFMNFFEGKYQKYGNYVAKHALISVVSNYMAKNASKYIQKSLVLPNLVDTDIFKKKRKPIADLRLICVAALRQGKRIDDIMAALKIIVEEKNVKNASLTIVGDGFWEEYYKNRCHELKMDQYVTFVGRKTKEEIADILQTHNLYVIASDKETFCISGIEALASGMPIVSSKCLGPEEYIDSKCGKLVEVGNIKEMAQAILDVYYHLEDYDIKYLRSVADRYSAKDVTDQAIKIYQNLLKEKNKKGNKL